MGGCREVRARGGLGSEGTGGGRRSSRSFGRQQQGRAPLSLSLPLSREFFDDQLRAAGYFDPAPALPSLLPVADRGRAAVDLVRTGRLVARCRRSDPS